MKKYTRRIVQLFALMLFQILVVHILAGYPKFITDYYTQTLYPYNSLFQRYLFGFLGFPMGDLVYFVLIVTIIYWIFTLLKNKFKKTNIFLYRMLLLSNLLYFSFHFFWGMNYYKEPFSKRFHLKTQHITQQDLFDVTSLFIRRANRLRSNLKQDKKGVFVNDVPFDRMVMIVSKAYDSLAKKMKLHAYTSKPLYVSWYSHWISYLGIGGYYNPFFGSAQVNGKITTMDYAMTISHEMAHQYGFASEKEANYMAFLNCFNSSNKDLRYSAYYNTIWRLLYEVYGVDVGKYKTLKSQLSERVKTDRKADILYYEKYHGKLSSTFSKANHLYLKANGQPGVSSYSKYVQLVLAQYVAEKNKTAKWKIISLK